MNVEKGNSNSNSSGSGSRNKQQYTGQKINETFWHLTNAPHSDNAKISSCERRAHNKQHSDRPRIRAARKQKTFNTIVCNTYTAAGMSVWDCVQAGWPQLLSTLANDQCNMTASCSCASRRCTATSSKRKSVAILWNSLNFVRQNESLFVVSLSHTTRCHYRIQRIWLSRSGWRFLCSNWDGQCGFTWARSRTKKKGAATRSFALVHTLRSAGTLFMPLKTAQLPCQLLDSFWKMSTQTTDRTTAIASVNRLHKWCQAFDKRERWHATQNRKQNSERKTYPAYAAVLISIRAIKSGTIGLDYIVLVATEQTEWHQQTPAKPAMSRKKSDVSWPAHSTMSNESNWRN